jgi:Flp pilus assembly protein protease CpaA
MYEVIFLIIIGIIWFIFASISDLKKREVANWVSFSLIIFVLGFRLFYSLFNNNFNFFYQGLFGLGIFLILANLLYYGRMFAGADAKLMIALGTILPFSENFLINIKIFVLFFILFLFVGGIYGLCWCFSLSFRNFRNFRKEFYRQFKNNKKLFYSVILLGLFLMILGFFMNITLIFYSGVLSFILSYLFLYTKAVDESCMIKKIPTKKLTEGDWLYKPIKVGKIKIKPLWQGLSRKDIYLLRKYKKEVRIREGIPYVPVFLFSFLILIYIYYSKLSLILWNSIW